ASAARGLLVELSSDENELTHNSDAIMDESSSILTTVNIRSAQKVQVTNNTMLPSFPNPAYKAFVRLIIKHHFSDSVVNDLICLFNTFYMDPITSLPSNAKAACKLLDFMHIPHIIYRNTVIMEYNQLQYTLYH
ncbi:15991_t:CDS:2, partial [Funneliformis geosporum]